MLSKPLSLFFSEARNFIKRTATKVFSCEFCKNFKNTLLLKEPLQVAASGHMTLQLQINTISILEYHLPAGVWGWLHISTGKSIYLPLLVSGTTLMNISESQPFLQWLLRVTGMTKINFLDTYSYQYRHIILSI